MARFVQEPALRRHLDTLPDQDSGRPQERIVSAVHGAPYQALLPALIFAEGHLESSGGEGHLESSGGGGLPLSAARADKAGSVFRHPLYGETP
jgi:hypothetical protein